jgi:esterase/lipase superfamily enzyme
MDDRHVPMPFANQLVLAAADIGEPEFSRQYDALSRSANHTTIYVSRWDGALAASSKLHKGGRVGLNPVSRGTMDVVDTNGLDTSLLDVNHGYLFDSQPVLYDLYEIVEDEKTPERRAALYRDDGACCWSFDHR